jgi:hypothetical protein
VLSYGRLNAKSAADHLDTLSHAQEPEAIVLFRTGCARDFKALTIIRDLHADDAAVVLNADICVAGFGMTRHIGQRLLRHTKKRRAAVTIT